MNQNIQEEITKELLAIKQEIDLQVPDFIIKGCQLLNLDSLTLNKKQDIIKALGGSKYNKDSQFIPKLRECLLNHLIRMKKSTLQSTNINPHKPLYLGQLITITMYYYEDRVIRSYSILEELTKHINKSIHLYFESIRPRLKEIKVKECELLNYIQQQPQQIEKIEETNFQKCYCHSQNGLFNQLKPKLKEFLKCNLCSLNFHLYCLQLNNVPQDFVCPYCTLLNINQLSKVADQVVQSTYQQFLQFKNERHFLFQCPKKHQGFQIEMRCLRIDGKDGLNEITWPDYGELLVNQIKIAEFQPLSLNYSLKKRKDDSINITNAIKFGEQNRITLIEHKPNDDQKKQFRIQQQCIYFISIFAIYYLKANELLMDIKQYQRNYLTIEDAFKQFEKEQNILQIKISLRCPITLQIINIPARGKFCNHLQCFDLQNFLIMMENQKEKKVWKCPICKLKCFKFIIDDYQQLILDIIQENSLLFEDLEFDSDGYIVDNLLRSLCNEKMKNQYYTDRIRKQIKI